MTKRISSADRDFILRSLRAGLVPKRGISHILVDRDMELREAKYDIDMIANGGSAFRIVVGRYGSGKTFFLTLLKELAHKNKLVVMSADLSRDRALAGGQGTTVEQNKAMALYRQLVTNCTCKSFSTGDALKGIIERWLTDRLEQLESANINLSSMIEEIKASLAPLKEEYVMGYTFRDAICIYVRSHIQGDETACENVIKWLRGEYNTLTELKRDLRLDRLIKEDNYYDMLKLLARFFSMAGYKGLLIILDETVALLNLSKPTRDKNYEKMLLFCNECHQGDVEGIGFYFGATPEVIEDEYKGVFSHRALKMRLQPQNRLISHSTGGPLIQLSKLTKEHLLALLMNIACVFNSGRDPNDEERRAIHIFYERIAKYFGDEIFEQPRELVRAFVEALHASKESNIPLEETIKDMTLAPLDYDSEEARIYAKKLHHSEDVELF